jgi:hypothetical protein
MAACSLATAPPPLPGGRNSRPGPLAPAARTRPHTPPGPRPAEPLQPRAGARRLAQETTLGIAFKGAPQGVARQKNVADLGAAALQGTIQRENAHKALRGPHAAPCTLCQICMLDPCGGRGPCCSFCWHLAAQRLFGQWLHVGGGGAEGEGPAARSAAPMFTLGVSPGISFRKFVQGCRHACTQYAWPAAPHALQRGPANAPALPRPHGLAAHAPQPRTA